MKRKRIISLIITATLPISMIGCSFDDYFKSSSKLSSITETELESETEAKTEAETELLSEIETEPETEIEVEVQTESNSSELKLNNKYSVVELDTIKEHITQLQESTNISGNAAKVKENMQILLDDLDVASEALSYLTISYYSDWYNEQLEYEYDSCYETYYVAYDLLCYAFTRCYKIEEYSAIFEPYVNMDYIDYFGDRSMSIKHIEGYAKVNCEVMDENLDEYYNIVYDDKMKNKAKNLRAAEIYLDILSSYDTETFYDTYYRDFSAEQAISLSNIIKKEIVPINDELGEILYNMPEYDNVYDNPIVFDNQFKTLATYTNEISPEINQSAKLLNNNSLYTMTSGDECYTGSFTTELPVQNSALIYTYQYGDCYDFSTVVHEFGHFHSALKDDTTTFMKKSNIDIAEVQSQGMEMLFMPLYDDIYKEQADAMRMLKLNDMLDSVISGFIIGEFEYTVLKNIDTMTPEDVVKYFDEMMDLNGYDTELYYISHLFEQPGYYISYGVSALAALDIWKVSLEDYDKAVNMYEKIAQIKSNSGEFQFKSALKQCGFNDVFDKTYVSDLSKYIKEYAESLD